jgi:hypothetical protein
MAKNELPPSVSKYITDELGRKLDEVVAHRVVNGTEPKYAVLMKDGEYFFTVIFVGIYETKRELGPNEEAYAGNVTRTGWDCVSDGDEWEHGVAKFKNASYEMF